MVGTFRAVSLLALAALVAAISACGSTSSADVKDTLDKGFSAPINSAKVNLDVTLTLNGVKQLNGPVKLNVQGPYESGGKKTIPKVDFDIAASAAGQNFSAGFISTGHNAWVNFQGQNYEVGRAAIAQVNKQIQQSAGRQKSGLSQFGIDPKSWLKDPKDEGTDTVFGVKTDHVSATLDVGAFLDDLNKLVQKAGGSVSGSAAPPQLTPAERKQIEDVVKNPTFDVYVGQDDNVIRRLSADISFDVPKAQQAQLGGLTDGTLSFSIEFSDVRQPQTITAPSSSKPLSELTQQLGGLSGALGGSGPSPAASQRYSKCLQKADPRKPAELQKCAKLVK
jgi:hypothetical protein